MILLVDIGNSRIKWSDRERLKSGHVFIADCTNLQEMLEQEWSRIPRPASVWVSSVASEQVVNQLADWTQVNWKITPTRVTSQSRQMGVVNGYVRPEQLGIDRWLSLVGARDRYRKPVIVVDCGTATTIDAMQQDGRHIGGLILPGLQMLRASLLGNTAIPQIGESSMMTCFARDTASGIDSARVLSTTCLIECVVESFQEKHGEKVECVLTGGSAEEIMDTLKVKYNHEPNLVLQGLALIANASQS